MSGGSDRGYHRSFDHAEVWVKEFDDPARDAWQKPDQVLDALGLERTVLVADLGAGTGYFSGRIAKRVPEGKVFAVDIEPDMVRYLRERGQQNILVVSCPCWRVPKPLIFPSRSISFWLSIPTTTSTTALHILLD
jgi:SAM-dependent methyltransferase